MSPSGRAPRRHRATPPRPLARSRRPAPSAGPVAVGRDVPIAPPRPLATPRRHRATSPRPIVAPHRRAPSPGPIATAPPSPRPIARGGSPLRCAAWQVAHAESFAGASPCAPHSRAGRGVRSPHPRHSRGTAPPRAAAPSARCAAWHPAPLPALRAASSPTPHPPGLPACPPRRLASLPISRFCLKVRIPCAPVHSETMTSSATPSSFSVLPKSENPLRSCPFRKNGLGCNYHPHSRFCLKVRIPCVPVHSAKMASAATPSLFSVLPKSENPASSPILRMPPPKKTIEISSVFFFFFSSPKAPLRARQRPHPVTDKTAVLSVTL